MQKITSYTQAIDYLYSQTPQFQQIGAAAYKPGLDTTRALDSLFDNPHKAYPVIHIAGTNGKGSTAHTIAAILQSAGYRTGLYTSPHLLDFRERIKVNGEMIPESEVISFLNSYLDAHAGIEPSFFELTTIMAFNYFRKENVDVAVIETGLGGRLDSTNIITPVLSVITNISKDHTAQLGNTLESIASEKAGIIKHGIPVVLGEDDNAAVTDVITEYARRNGSPLTVAGPVAVAGKDAEGNLIYPETQFGEIHAALTGDCQPKNTATILAAIPALRSAGFTIPDDAVKAGFTNVTETTGLMGRWMEISESPLTIADTGHNIGGWRYIAEKLRSYGTRAHIVIGFVNDKDITPILPLLPADANYYFTRASVPRALPETALMQQAQAAGLDGESYPDVATALEAARANAGKDDFIFVGGSTFIISDLLSLRNNA